MAATTVGLPGCDMPVMDGSPRCAAGEIARSVRSRNGVPCKVSSERAANQAGYGNIDRSIQAIVGAGTFISELGAKMRAYEIIISGFQKTIADHKSRAENAYQRAILAEARAEEAEEQIRRLVLREKTTLDHLDRAMKAVDTSFIYSQCRDKAARVRP